MSLLPLKFPTEKLAGYPSSLQWNAKLGGGIAGLAMICQKRLYFIISAQRANFAGIWQVDCVKIVNFYIESFNSKTDWLFFLFAMVCKTWCWYYRFGCGASFPQSDKKLLDCVILSLIHI